MIQLLLFILSLQTHFLTFLCDRIRMEKFEFISNPEYIRQNGSLDPHGIINLDIEVLQKVENARTYLAAQYGKEYKNSVFNKSINLNKAVNFMGVTPLTLAIISLIKDRIDVPFVFPVAKVWLTKRHST